MNRRLKVGVLGMGLFIALTAFAPSAKAADYTVTPDDSLFKIGVIFDSTTDELQSLNKLKSNEIKEGQVLEVPADEYTIQPGNSLYSIAEEHNLSIATLRIANDKWDNIIYAGDTLIIPQSEGHERLRNLLYPSYYANHVKDYSKMYTLESIPLGAPAVISTTASTTKSATSNDGTKAVSNTTSVINYTSEELDLLARLITAEATGQPYDAMVSVGAVVVNRVQDKEWPSSIKSVVNQVGGGYYQFSPVENGSINNAASAKALQAAKEALSGVDKSYGALYFFDTSSNSDWLRARSETVRYDRMIFTK